MLVKNLLLLFCFCSFGLDLSYAPMFVSTSIDSDEIEFDCTNDKIAVVDRKSISVIDSKTGARTEIRKFKKRHQAIAKICLSDNCVFLNTETCKFKSIDFSGKTLFKRQLPSVSRSCLFVDGNNVFFSLINQYVVCYSKNGQLVWINKEYYTEDLIFKNHIKVGKYVYLLHKNGLSVLEKRTGFPYCVSDKFKTSSDFYVVNDDVICSISNYDFVSYEIMSGRCVKDQNYFPQYFISGKFRYSYKDGVVKNIDNGTEYHFSAQNFEFFDGKVFVYNKDTYSNDSLMIINGDDVAIHNLNFKIKKLLYKNGMLVLFDGANLHWANI